jgi:hypothetical protein
MKWFRLYDTVLDDPKVQRLKPELFKAWINLLCIASKKDGQIPVDPDDLGFMLRCDPETAEHWLVDLIDAGLIELRPDHATPHQWDEYQYVSDSSTERVRAFRERKKTPNGGPDPDPKGGKQHETFHETLRSVSHETKRNALESESESESEKESQSRAHTRARPTDRLEIKLLEKTVALFGRDSAKLGRIMSGATQSRAGPEAYLNGVLAREAVPRSAPIAQPYVFVEEGTSAWTAWCKHRGVGSMASRIKGGRVGAFFASAWPPEMEKSA